MKKQYFFILGTILLLISMVSAYEIFGEKIIKDDEYTKITLYKNREKEGPFVITDKKVINQIIQKINSSPREDLSKIEFERGPDGRIIFEGKNKVYEVRVFSDTGDVVTKNYYINTAFKLNEVFK